MQAFLSIVIPAYNSQSTIEESLNSLPDESNLEIIVVNDGSSDETASVVERNFQRFKYTQCHLIHTENCGLGSARNTGIEHSNGRYISFLDADDLWTKNRLQNIKKTIELYPHKKWFYSGIIELSPNGNKRLRKISRTPKSIFELIRYNPITPSAVTLHQSIANERIFIEDKNQMGLEDLILWVDLWVDGHRPQYSGNADVIYRMGHGMSHQIEDHLLKFEKVLEEFKQRGIIPDSASEILMGEKNYQAGRHYQKLDMKKEALNHFSKAPFSISKFISLLLLRLR